MRAERGEVWQVDFGMAAKIRPALLLTGEPADDELDLFTVLLHTTATRGNRWELVISKSFLKPGAFHLQQVQTISGAKLLRRLGCLTNDKLQLVEKRLLERFGL
ncbi:MAG: type II toxin-antitoxin system PemK/MazF family toxin [Verrucomicrobia bacterium]|nr:type II toxin-antitoxin system PemK/MazF family toxin [Verrucomicrobiota bacterium]